MAPTSSSFSSFKTILNAIRATKALASRTTQAAASATPTSANSTPLWTKSSIIVGAVGLGFILLFLLSLTAFICTRRRARKQLPPEHRPVSYHPFRTVSNTSTEDKAGLLESTTPVDSSPDIRRPSMFGRERGSSVSLFVDQDAISGRRVSMESLIPLQTSPTDHRRQEPVMAAARKSSGSGVSSLRTTSSRYSLATSVSGGLSPIGVAGSITLPKTRPRSSSSSSSRYYAMNSPDGTSANSGSCGGTGNAPNTRPRSSSSARRYYVGSSPVTREIRVDIPAVPPITFPKIVRTPSE